ncbi:ribonuclease HII [Infirmifilum uzonense]|uniref:ribonuclease HII n=1 Tax=Infirmifilum uzonense TaxID=1550241 RepID=UPI000ACBCB50|nr:ribonuclease HII [Infirmifilum uzonense]
MAWIAGVDEAGRGPVIGPMVVALVALDESRIGILENIGVKDSKMLSPSRRERIRKILEEILEYTAIRVVQPREIDEAVEGISSENLNSLEATVIADLVLQALKKIGLSRVYVDSPDPVAERFGRILATRINKDIVVVAENHADIKYPIVSAASIIAKSEREKIISELKRVYGDFGSGYPSDPKTREFLKRLLENNRELPPIVRRSWKTLSRLM